MSALSDPNASRKLKPSARSLFLLGMDTVEIAERLGVLEAVASRFIFVARCREKGLPAIVERRPS